MPGDSIPRSETQPEAKERDRRPDASHGPSRVVNASATDAVDQVVARLREGGLVSFPTDTVYALAASLVHPAALDRIFAAKGRPRAKPVPVLIAAPDALDRVALDPAPAVVQLLERFWPGGLTVVLPARAGLPTSVLGSDRSVAVRLPDHAVAIALIGRAGGAVAATSANRSGRPPALDVAEVQRQLGGAVDLILDGGATPGALASTVIGFNGEELRILREGPIPGCQLEAAWRGMMRLRPATVPTR